VLAGTLLALCPCLFALNPTLDINQYGHTAWKIRDGFFKSVIISIAQTPDGYLWFGTEFGLLRFDGVRAVPWQPPNGEELPSNYIRSLLVSRDGTLWIGTAKGLSSWKDGKLTQYSQTAGRIIGGVVEDHLGTIWFGLAFPGEICQISGGRVACQGKGELGIVVGESYEDRQGNFWVTASTGLRRMRPGPPQNYRLTEQSAQIDSVIEADDSSMLLSTNVGLRRLAGRAIEKYSPPGVNWPFRPSGFFRTREGDLWIKTAGQGLLHVRNNRTDWFAQADGLSGDNIYAMFEDREGSVWVATDAGLDRFRDVAIPAISTKQGLSNNGVWSVWGASDGSIWFGSPDGATRLRDGQFTIYRQPRFLGSSKLSTRGLTAASSTGEIVREIADSGLPAAVESFFEDTAGRLWVATPLGLSLFGNGRFTSIPGVPGGQFYDSAEDQAGDLWVVNQDHGLLHLRDKKLVEVVPWATLGIKDWGVRVAKDPKGGGIWVAPRESGLIYIEDGRVQAKYSDADGLGRGRVLNLRAASDGSLWASTEDGLSRVSNGRITTLSDKNGLPCSTVSWSMEDAAGALWLYAPPCGLLRVDRAEMQGWIADPNRTVKFALYDNSDGFVQSGLAGGYGPRVTKAADGRLWLATGSGVNVVDPNNLPLNSLPPPVSVEQVTANGKPYAIAQGLHLPARIRDLAIHYTALSLVSPEKVRFRYKLEGQDHDWREVVNVRQVQYSNLVPGNYRFRVMACNNSGVWNEEGATLDFSIAPAFYQTNWFRGLCAAVFLALLWGLYRLRVQQLEQQERKFREAIETIPVMAFTARPDGSRTFVNRRWVEYTGLTVEQAAGPGWQKAVHPDDIKRVIDKWQVSLATGEPLEYESRFRRAADGEYRWFLVRVVPLADKRGKIMKWCGTATDIEDRKRAEQLHADLAHINRVTTMGELTASLAHEIKQPIAATVTNANTCLLWLKRDHPDLEEIREAAKRIVADGQRAADVIDHLRSLYKKAPPQRELVAVNEVIREMAQLLRGEATRYGVSIRTDPADDLPKVMADHVQLQQVLMNLMLNGIEAMKETGGVLTVKSQSAPDGRVRISVSDTGVGLPAENADQIFSAFFTTKPEGSGMGLAISRSIVESHGGRLWATANDGRGASFHFSLPTAGDLAKAPAAGS